VTGEASGAATEWPAAETERVLACPVCGTAERAPLHRDLRDHTFEVAPGAWTLWRCGGCGSAYLDPRPGAESIHRAYGGDYFTHSPGDHALAPTGLAGRARVGVMNGYLNARWGYEAEPSLVGARAAALAPPLAARADRWVRHLPAPAPGDRLLDIGSGSGAFLAQMRELGWTVEGVEPDPAAVAVARGAGIAVTEGTVGAFDEPAHAGAFSAVTMSHVIEHLHELRGTLAAVRRLLRPSGTLWLATPNLRSLGHRLFGANWLGLDPPRHLVLFTHASLARLLVNAGFEGVAVRRASAEAVLTFPASAQVAARRAGDDRAAEAARALGMRALLADLVALQNPEVGEDVVLTARAPARRGADGRQ
jgi:2-polyprenyl-3-methyl-5-hydroxy-6-metoxy-1,4-benzoquinol methylase